MTLPWCKIYSPPHGYQNIVLVAVEEAHCVQDWLGTTLLKVRSVFTVFKTLIFGNTYCKLYSWLVEFGFAQSVGFLSCQPHPDSYSGHVQKEVRVEYQYQCNEDRALRQIDTSEEHLLTWPL